MGLDNDAFRKFVDDASGSGQKKAKQKKTKTTTKPGVGRGAKPAPKEDEKGPKYRDRADERRRGITVEESAPSYLTAEETRYLGGSMERTHLVRGLDRLLLNQVRNNVVAPAEKDIEAPDAELDAAEKEDLLPSTFQTALGRSIGTYLLNPPASNIAELFLPKRMAFVYFAEAKGSDDEEEDEEEADGEQEGEGAAKQGEMWGPDDAENGSTRTIPETLLRPKADCPEPPDALNAAIDKPVITEVIGVLRAVHAENKHRGKDKKKNKDEAAMSLSEVQEEKERHILQLRKFENPKLVAELAARDAAAAKAQPAVDVSKAATKRTGGAKAAAARGATGGDEDSGGSGLFDDVGDDYEVDTSELKKKQHAKGGKKGQLFVDTMNGLPAVAQHGDARGNDGGAEPSAAAPQSRSGRCPPGPPAAHGYPPPRPGYPSARSGTQRPQRHQEQYPGYPPGHHPPQGYYDNYGNRITSGPGQTPQGGQYQQRWGGYGSEQYGAAVPYLSATDLAAQQQQQQKVEDPASRGKGFSAKMGDRAVVKSAFSLEQRQAKVGKGVVEGGEDEYGAEILVGGGGLDHEEEEDLKDMESRGRTLNREDFHTDEQFQAYKASKEAAPKAAFQFGVKMQDGRRSHKDMEKASTKKLDSQLRSIRDMKGNVGGRKVDFGKFDGAFGGKGSEVAATPSRKRIKL